VIISYMFALLGDTQSQYKLGKYYWHRNNAYLANKWLYYSAQQGNTNAGRLWVKLVKTLSSQWDKQYPRALDWQNLIISKAHIGNPQAQYQLGLLYQYGQTYANMHDALIWYRKSSQSYYPAALLKLGIVYDMGIGVRPNKWLARHYYLTGEWYAHHE
jgi:TPR repeat protein